MDSLVSLEDFILIHILFLIITCDLMIIYELFFFFFQAEDGIRDKLLTGVQTCALPISLERGGRPLGRVALRDLPLPVQHVAFRGPAAIGEDSPEEEQRLALERVAGGHEVVLELDHRSEERRVGKECRSRWSPYH